MPRWLAPLFAGRATAAPGFALLIVLWSIVLLALFATGITASGRLDLRLAGNLRRAAAVQAAADGGVFAAIVHVMDPSARSWPPNGQVRAVPFGRYALAIRIADENRKVNPNFAQPGLLIALFAACGAEQAQASALADAVAEWHTPGARDAAVARYRRAGLAAAPTGQPFASTAELGLVAGMTPALLARLMPYMSVYTAGPLNFVQADPVIQQAVRVSGGSESATAPATNVIDVTSEAASRDGARFVRHAVVGLARGNTDTPYRILVWESLPAS